MIRTTSLFTLFIIFVFQVHSQGILPPEIAWSGKSGQLIADQNNPWITPAEKSNFKFTATFDEAHSWLKKLCDSDPNLHLISLGESAMGRSLMMVVASTETKVDAVSLSASSKPTLLVHAGIHAGEIDGKDAGMMLLRDISKGDKKSLIEKVNFLFIPILNVDGHERVSPYNRINQRGPHNMGWRTNAKNLNLNRDFMKLETEEVGLLVDVLHEYAPDLYVDVHVTDGADYQYDITYGYLGPHAFSPNASQILDSKIRPAADSDLEAMGHIPGPLLFAMNGMDFSEGTSDYTFLPLFSNAYGDICHIPSILVENHSLKPFKQRVLGTYVLLESFLKNLGLHGAELKAASDQDRQIRREVVKLSWKFPMNDQGKLTPSGTMTMKAVESKVKKSEISGATYVEWTGEKVQKEVDVYSNNTAGEVVLRPKSYIIPSAWKEVISKLKKHRIQMEVLNEDQTMEVEMYKIEEVRFANQMFEGHLKFSGRVSKFKTKEFYPSGSVLVNADQPLGDLAVYLLEPECDESLFKWGYFNGIFSRTEYIESYIMEPEAQKMLDADPALKLEFEEKMKDLRFANDAGAIMKWFYSKTPYIDSQYLIYPVARILK